MSTTNITTTITVFGATGTQGGSIVRSLLSSDEAKLGVYHIRAITRDPSSASAQELKANGHGYVEVLKAEFGDIDALRAAVKSADIVFGVTNASDGLKKGEPEFELTQAKNLVDAAKAEGCKVFIWSSVPSAKEFSKGKYDIPLFENKQPIVKYLEEKQVPYVSLNCPPFAENLWKYHQFYKLPSGEGYELRIPRVDPESKVPILWVERDFGDAVLHLIRRYNDKEVAGKSYDVATEVVSFTHYAEILSKAIGDKVTYKRLDSAEMGPVFTPIMNDMFDFYSEYGQAHMPQIPDPGLLKLGHKPATLEEFAKSDACRDFVKRL